MLSCKLLFSASRIMKHQLVELLKNWEGMFVVLLKELFWKLSAVDDSQERIFHTEKFVFGLRFQPRIYRLPNRYAGVSVSHGYGHDVTVFLGYFLVTVNSLKTGTFIHIKDCHWSIT